MIEIMGFADYPLTPISVHNGDAGFRRKFWCVGVLG